MEESLKMRFRLKIMEKQRTEEDRRCLWKMVRSSCNGDCVYDEKCINYTPRWFFEASPTEMIDENYRLMRIRNGEGLVF